MLINSELKRMVTKLRAPEAIPDPHFKSLLDPLKPEENVSAQKRLCHFDLLVHRKRNLPAFFNGTWQMTHRGDKWRTDEAGMLNYLIGIVINHFNKHSMMVLYDNSIAGERCDREIFKLLHDEVKVNRLPEYSSIISKKLPEWMSYEVKP